MLDKLYQNYTSTKPHSSTPVLQVSVKMFWFVVLCPHAANNDPLLPVSNSVFNLIFRIVVDLFKNNDSRIDTQTRV